MIAFFEQRGISCYAPALTPSDGRTGLDDLAQQLKRYIDNNIEYKRDFSIIGFSMGAMITRFYLQRLGGFNTTQQFFSVCGPHKGSLWSYFYPGKGTKQMRPGSAFLRELNDSVDCLCNMEIYSYWTPFDLVIMPPTSSIWHIAQNIKINALCHPCMLSNQFLFTDVYDKLRERAPKLLLTT